MVAFPKMKIPLALAAHGPGPLHFLNNLGFCGSRTLPVPAVLEKTPTHDFCGVVLLEKLDTPPQWRRGLPLKGPCVSEKSAEPG